MNNTEIDSFFSPSRLYIGAGSYKKIGELLRQRNSKRVFITIDAAVGDSPFGSYITQLLKEEGVETAIFSEIESDPSAHTVEKAFQICRAHEATHLLAIGGGSTIDVAKAVGILATNGGRIHDYEGIEKFSTPPLPMIAIPTTAGTGSEVSGSCVITDTDLNRKMSIRHATLNPATIAILDPLALCSMPAHVAAHSGLDAFVHGFESYISRRANFVTDALNLRAIELITGNIRQFVSNRDNLQAGMGMLCGSAMAGIAFGQTGLGNVHCMARFVGAFFHLSHGLSNAVCLPHVARFNLQADPKKFARIAAAMDRPVHNMAIMDAAHAAVEAIENLCRDLDIPSRLRDVGVKQERIDEMARLCFEANYNRWNPRNTTVEDFRTLFNQAF